jgi:polyphosphate kinase 2 (PPK2 family)
MSKNVKIDPEKFRVLPGRKIKLKQWPTKVKPFYTSEEDYKKRLEQHVKNLRSMQDRFYACNRYALLLIFQATDAAGKDSAIKHVMSGVNPQGCQVFSFKQPSAGELEHDFLWRTTHCLPERGHIGIFNRSYYDRPGPSGTAGKRRSPGGIEPGQGRLETPLHFHCRSGKASLPQWHARH